MQSGRRDAWIIKDSPWRSLRVPGLHGLYNIPMGCPFAERLAEGVIEAWGDDPLALSRVTIFLPTRRACRAQREAFLRVSAGQALVLPRLAPLGDLDDEELRLAEGALFTDVEAEVHAGPVMPELERCLLLAQLIGKWEDTGDDRRAGQRIGDERAVALARELARLIDQVETEELDFMPEGGEPITEEPVESVEHALEMLDDRLAGARAAIAAASARLRPTHFRRLSANPYTAPPKRVRTRAIQALG